MEKKYTSPEMKIVNFEAGDIIQTSGTTPITAKLPKNLDGATSVAPQTFDVFK